MKRLLHAALALLAGGALLLLPGYAVAEDKIKVVATFTVIADMVTNVAGVPPSVSGTPV
jgi:ABC-type Zn uptake system ZnuABC Zn-binding protein ZnuA